jgi:hypothetical protein
MIVEPERIESVDQVVNRLEFDEEGNAGIDLEGILFLKFQRTRAIQLRLDALTSVDQVYDVDTHLINSAGLSKGRKSHDYSNLRSFEDFEMTPGTNRLEISLYEKNKPEVKKLFIYEFDIDGRIYANEHVTFIMEDGAKNHSNEFLDRMTQLAMSMESHLVGSSLVFRLSSSQYGESAEARQEYGWIEVASNEHLDEQFFECVFVHEKAHDFYDQIQNMSTMGFALFFKKNKERGIFGKRNVSAGEEYDTIHEFYHPNTPIGVFAERYYKGQPERHGHPWYESTELFASATAIMRLYPEQLIEKIAGLPTQSGRDFAREVMSRVIGLYERYCITGTQLFPQRVLDYAKGL